MASPSFLHDADLRLLFLGGKGGVGKTTCAAAAAIRMAADSPRRTFLLVSTDPAHSVYDCLAGSPTPQNLGILEFNAGECLGAFKEKHSPALREIARRGTFLDDQDIAAFLDLSLPGLDEIMALLEIARLVNESAYDCIVVDTAPTGHTLRLLSMPRLIRDWLSALDALLAKSRYMRMLIAGSFRADSLDDFLLGFSGDINRMEELLGNRLLCRFVPVMIAEAMSVHETRTLLDNLASQKVSATDILVNKIRPPGPCPLCTSRHDLQMQELRHCLRSRRFKHHTLWAVPFFVKEPNGIHSLSALWESVTPISEVPRKAAVPTMVSQSFHGDQSGHLLPHTRLTFFIGKGGVGKTTLACATAVQLASESPKREVMLFSLDPAHSLSACLQVKVGPKPRKIAPHLTAVEIDPDSEFQALRQQARADVERFLQSALSNIDLAFDREVLERIVDLSPPGLDEIVALTHAMDLAGADRYDHLVVDAAPSGHFIRFMELPDLITEWLKVIFGVLLKYRNIFGLPSFSRRLVKLSRSIKALAAELRDPARSSLYVVTIPTEIAFEETRDLVATCLAMGFRIPGMFINLAAPPSDCVICSSLHTMEAGVIAEYERAFPEMKKITVYDGRSVLGLGALEQLGNRLYGFTPVEWLPQAR